MFNIWEDIKEGLNNRIEYLTEQEGGNINLVEILENEGIEPIYNNIQCLYNCIESKYINLVQPYKTTILIENKKKAEYITVITVKEKY